MEREVLKEEQIRSDDAREEGNKANNGRSEVEK